MSEKTSKPAPKNPPRMKHNPGEVRGAAELPKTHAVKSGGKSGK